MILIVTVHFADYHVIAKNVNLMLAVIVFIVISHLYMSTRCSGQTHIMSTHIQEVAGVVTIVIQVTTTQLTTGPGIAILAIMIFVTTALEPCPE